MPGPGLRLAYLAHPRLHKVSQRERSFRLLDGLCEQPVIYMGSGPPGAGKTTLVARYLNVRKLPHIRYQVDGGDANPSSSFY